MFTISPEVNSRLETEIQTIIQSMRTAAETQREYSIGALSALLWAQSGGETLRSTAFVQACAWWDKMREEAPA
ncbi:MAG: hypothetical protein DYG89_15080 [Caldilinea sp. CFX5]|nr:hypothetical protein [Caldilinea sp. CFX5]